jgi:hypothetical protein
VRVPLVAPRYDQDDGWKEKEKETIQFSIHFYFTKRNSKEKRNDLIFDTFPFHKRKFKRKKIKRNNVNLNTFYFTKKNSRKRKKWYNSRYISISQKETQKKKEKKRIDTIIFYKRKSKRKKKDREES